jgi:hypothetical protein
VRAIEATGKPGRIFIALPAMESVHPRLLNRLYQTAALTHPAPVLKLSYRLSPVNVARNFLLQQFIATHCEWLVMIDSDVVPPENFLATLVGEAHEKGYPFTCGYYAMQLPNANPRLSIGHRLGNTPLGLMYQWCSVVPPGWFEVDACGFGLVAIHRYLLEDLPANPFVDWVHPDPTKLDYCRTEDVEFCELVASLHHVKPMCHHALGCEHWHMMELTSALSMHNEIVDAMLTHAAQEAEKEKDKGRIIIAGRA